MSKFYGLVKNIEELRNKLKFIQEKNQKPLVSNENRSIEDIEEKNEVQLPIYNILSIVHNNDNHSVIDKEDKDIYKGLYTLYNEKYQKLSYEIIQINVKREELWKSIDKVQKYLEEVDILDETKVKYRDFILEMIELPSGKKEIDFLNIKLDTLYTGAKKNDIKFDKYEGFFRTLYNKTTSPLKTTKEERKLEAIYEAQAIQFAHLKIFFEHYVDSLKLQVPYLDEAIKVTKAYRELLNTLLDLFKNKIFSSLETINLFFKAWEIKKLVANNKIKEAIALDDIKITINIGELKNTKYEIYHIFYENILYLYTAIETAFKENILTRLLNSCESTLNTEEMNMINSRIRDVPRKYPGFGTFDCVISIDSCEERYIYSTDDIKFLDYAKSIEENKKVIEDINQKLDDVNSNIENIEKIANTL